MDYGIIVSFNTPIQFLASQFKQGVILACTNQRAFARFEVNYLKFLNRLSNILQCQLLIPE
jgi:hypothetical protein